MKHLIAFSLILVTNTIFSQIVIVDKNNKPIPFVEILSNNNYFYAQTTQKGELNWTDLEKLNPTLIISPLCVTPFFSYCQDTMSGQEILIMFKKINKSDRSKQKYPEQREKIFLENFTEIKHLIEKQGFVNLNSTYSNKRHRKIIKHGIARTFTHILQTHPELILNRSFIKLISNEINAGRFCNDCLIAPLSIYVYDNDIKSPFKGELINALNAWNLSESDIIVLSP